MLTIIHGDDTAASRTHYLQIKEKYPEATTMDGQSINLTDLAQILEGGGLFTEETTLFIENFIQKKKTSSDYKEIVSYLNDQAKTATIVLWEGKELERSTLTPFKQSIVKPFKLPQSLFMFLDAIKPHNGPQLIQLFHKTIATVEPEAVFAMLVRQIRILLALRDKPAEIEEIKRLQDWQRGKLISQSKQFSADELINLFCQLFVMEEGMKTGKLNIDLVTAIDIFLLEI